MGAGGNNSSGRSRTDAEFCWFPHFSRLEASACEWVLCFSKDSGTEIYLLQQPLISYHGNKSSDSIGHSAPMVNLVPWRAKRKVADSPPKDKALWRAKPQSRNWWEQKFSLHAARWVVLLAEHSENRSCDVFLFLSLCLAKILSKPATLFRNSITIFPMLNWKTYCLRHVFS